MYVEATFSKLSSLFRLLASVDQSSNARVGESLRTVEMFKRYTEMLRETVFTQKIASVTASFLKKKAALSYCRGNERSRGNDFDSVGPGRRFLFSA